MSFDMTKLPGWKAAREAMCHVTVEQFDDICLVISQAYAKGIEDMLAKAQEANLRDAMQREIDRAVREVKR